MKEQRSQECPEQQGMYDPSFEHDNCGIGAVVNIKGIKSHKTVEDALSIVENLEHRAGKDAEGKTGDGVGIMVQISHKFFSKECAKLGIELGGEREYGIGMFFLPQDELKRNQAKKMFEIIVEKEPPIRRCWEAKHWRRCQASCRHLSRSRRMWKRDWILTGSSILQDEYLSSPSKILMWYPVPAVL